MIKKINLIFISFLILFSFSIFAWESKAQLLNDAMTNDQTSAFITGAGIEDSDVGVDSIVATIISVFLGILGIIFIVLIIYSGFNWMTASGDEGKIETAKKTLSRAIIGLIIIVAAYAITKFVFTHLPGGGGGPAVGP